MNRLPDERDMDQVVRSWMRGENEQAADRNRQVGRIMGRIDETRQRRGAWRFLPFGRTSRRVDAQDEELYVAGGGAVAMRRGVSSAMAIAAVVALVLTAAALLALVPRTSTPGAGGASPTPSATVHPDDAELLAAFAGVWSGERTSLADVTAVYDEDAVHMVLWHDQVERIKGVAEIWKRIRDARNVDPSNWIPLPDAPNARPGERRYLGVSNNLGGIACLGTVRAGRIQRHDCIMPIASDGPVPAWETTPADTLEVRERLWSEFVPGFADRDRELIDASVSPDIVHHVAYILRETLHEGRDQYMTVMGLGTPEELADPIPLPAPEGQHRWTDYSNVGGGALCTFWTQDEKLIRHDCVVPSP